MLSLSSSSSLPTKKGASSTVLLLLIFLASSCLFLFSLEAPPSHQHQQASSWFFSKEEVIFIMTSSLSFLRTTTITKTNHNSEEIRVNDKETTTADKILFQKWLQQYNKSYDSLVEQQYRQSIFYHNIHETFKNRGNHGVFGIDEYTDLTSQEFVQKMIGESSSCYYYDDQEVVVAKDHHEHYSYNASMFMNISIDWRNHNNEVFVTPVKNQGPYGTCWSFGIAENLEGLNVRQGNELVNISEQEFISCCHECQGRKEEISLEWLLNTTNGIPALESSYPYKGSSSIPCAVDTAKRAKVQVHSWTRVFDHDGTGISILAALMEHGPMGIGVDASCFHGYKGGIIQNCGNSSIRGSINHAVLLVGAGTSNDGIDYFIIKNSWGTGFGEDGYVRIERGHPEWWGNLSVLYIE